MRPGGSFLLPRDVVTQVSALGVTKVICLYADPSTRPFWRAKDCDMVEQCHVIATQVASHNIFMPKELDPRGRVPLWRRLVATVRPVVEHDLKWLAVPFLLPNAQAKIWAQDCVRHNAQGKPVLIVSPMSGAPKGTVVEQWWWTLAKRFDYGIIIIPVHQSEVTKVQTLFGNLQNVKVVATDIAQAAGLAAIEGVHVLGVDGGRMNVLAASRRTGALCIYGEWPASAWAMPNVVARESDITPDEAIMAVP